MRQQHGCTVIKYIKKTAFNEQIDLKESCVLCNHPCRMLNFTSHLHTYKA
jgi:hypothetical protein